MNLNGNTQLSDALRWALEAMQSPSMASADWLAMDIDPHAPSATALLSDPNITLDQVRKAKSVFKTMRIVGETSSDRRIGARMYAAAIAAGILRHGKRVSRQSDRAITRALQGLVDDRRMPPELSQLAGMALCVLKDARGLIDDAPTARMNDSDGSLPMLDDDQAA
jgi:hypothetical protein